MKLEELKPLGEHRTSPHGGPVSFEQQVEWLARAKRLAGIVGATSSQALSIFKVELDAKTTIILLTKRTQQDVPVGYAVLSRTSIEEVARWVIADVWLKVELRNQGIITNLYSSLSALGFKLQSGVLVSKEAESVWKKLGSAGLAKVLDSQTGSIEDFSLKPIGDGDIFSGEDPRYFWVTEGTLQNTFYHRLGAEALKESFNFYLDGIEPGSSIPSSPKFKVIGIEPLLIEADV